eukprot:TRINITY_DN740_c0_g1_i1.p1 TRINITY_DN740_c0_g1~~TRINITY_DN740_c0_g1_i1.p1  ORF type:complete len:542 (+),score=247.99 TRINITY_DN740_c0_g1_i1:25-1626(+)
MKLLVVLVALVACAAASSHSEAPGTAKQPQADVTDFYMFQSYEQDRSDYTVFIMNVQPLQNPIGGPNYFALSDAHFYEIYVDNNADTKEDISFQMFCGSRLGGEIIDVPFESDEDDDCNVLARVNQNQSKKRSFGIEQLTVQRHGGVELPIAPGHSVPIALKVFGQNGLLTDGTPDESGLNFFEWCRMNVVFGDRSNGRRERVTPVGQPDQLEFRKPFDNAGTKSFPDYESYARSFIHEINLPNCERNGRFFVGQRKEPFHIRLGAIFDLVNFVPVSGFTEESDEAHNDLRALNIDSFVLEVPTECVLDGGDDTGIIAAWTAVRELQHDGEAHVAGKQVSRLGHPLVNELFIGLRDKGKYNSDEPKNDGQFLEYVQYPTLPFILDLLFKDTLNSALGSAFTNVAPEVPRNDLVTAFLTGVEGLNQPPGVVPGDQLRLNTAIPVKARGSQSNLGVIDGDNAGFPNGRRPGDDTVDIALRVAMGKLCHLPLDLCAASSAPVGDVPFTDGAPVSDLDFDNVFPFLTSPVPGADGSP